MKPSWKNAPAEARYLAMDDDGSWWWYRNQPKINDDHGCWEDADDYYARLAYAPGEDWQSSLEVRLAKKPKKKVAKTAKKKTKPKKTAKKKAP